MSSNHCTKVSKQAGGAINRRAAHPEAERYAVLDGTRLRVCDVMPDGTLVASARYWHAKLEKKREPD